MTQENYRQTLRLGEAPSERKRRLTPATHVCGGAGQIDCG